MEKKKIAGIALILVGVGIATLPAIGQEKIKENGKQELQAMTKKSIEENQKQKADFDFSKVKSIDPKASLTAPKKFASSGSFERKALATKKTSGAIGEIAVTAVKMQLPIMKGLSDYALSTGAGTMRADQKMGEGNYPLAGHYMTDKGALFSPVERIEKGDRIYISDLKKVYQYKAVWRRKVSPYATYLVNNTKKKYITLITCADGGVNRWAVRGKLVKAVKATKANLKVLEGGN